ncbi:MAG: SAM-dependent methyltransferase [Actinobacteria bacterium]|nr:SAM-dependent methyltransferase [Actinomycetota bacterium]
MAHSSGSRPRGITSGPFSSASDATAPPPGWPELLTDEGRDRLADASAWIVSGATSQEAGSRLRASGTAPELVAAVLTQLGLREKARSKFGDGADRMLFTQAGLEQATRAPVAALHARRFASAGCRSVTDLGCGIGAESLALQQAGIAPLPVEIDSFTAAIAEHNLSVPVTVGDAESADLSGADGAVLDPARRTAGHRDTRRLASPDDYSPSLGFAFGVAERLPTGIKLGPGFERELIPSDAEAQWVSMDGQLVETGLWFGAVARPGIRRAALVLRSSGEGVDSHELTAAADARDVETRQLGEYLFEPDGAVIRARLIGLLAERLRAGMVGDGIAYLTADTADAAALATPFAQVFRVLEELPAGEKQLRRALAERGIGRLEIKKRGVFVDPAALRTRLKLKGPHGATLILTRTVGESTPGKHVALLAERV